jgi:prophage antirepressor-like protein
MSRTNKVILFGNNQIRRQFYNDEWWFSINDIINAIAESSNPADYLKKLRKRDQELNKLWENDNKQNDFQNNFKGGGQIVPPLTLPFQTKGGTQKVKCWNTEGIFRLIQSITSKKAEPFKRWLAKVGYERVQEIGNPELAQKRMKMLYRLKGYNEEWIARRVRGIAIREELTDEWQKRGIKQQEEYAILTSEISKASFGITPSEYKELKGLEKENLRDHMDDLELLFTELGEAATTRITQTDNSQGFAENKESAKRGGAVAGRARKDLEKQTKKKVISSKNYKNIKTIKQSNKGISNE